MKVTSSGTLTQAYMAEGQVKALQYTAPVIQVNLS